MNKESSRLCTKCGKSAPEVKFYKSKKGKDGLQSQCNVCTQKQFRLSPGFVNGSFQAKLKVYYQQNKEKLKEYNRCYCYNIPVGWFENTLQEQGGACAICQGASKDPRLCVDHCHTSHHVRRIICSRCNHALGHIFDNPVTARRMADYLEQDYTANPVVDPKKTRDARYNTVRDQA